MKPIKIIGITVILLSLVIGLQFKPVNASTMLPAVINLKAEVTADKMIKVSWDNAFSTTGYHIAVTKEYDQVTPDAQYNGFLNPATVYYYSPSQEHRYYIFVSYEYQGRASDLAWTYVDFKTPSAPSNLTVSEVKWYGVAVLTWADVNDFETGWAIDVQGSDGSGTQAFRHIDLGPNSDSDMRVTITTPLVPEGYYTFKVWAKNGLLAGISKQISTYIPMCSPSNLTATAKIWASGPGVQLVWTDNSFKEDYFQIERTNPDGTKTFMNETLGDRWYGDENLGYMTTYKYRIRAVSNSIPAYNSAWTDPVSITTSKVSINIGPALAIQPLKPINILTPSILADILEAAAEAATAEEPDPNIIEEDPEATEPPIDSEDVTTLKFYVGKSVYSAGDTQFQMDAAPIIMFNRTMLPVRYAAEPLGATAVWNQEDQKVTITFGSDILEFWIGHNIARMNGVDTMIDPDNANVMPVIIPPGRALLPLRFIGESLGCDVEWNQLLQEATLTKTN